jgi:hypothetical protein
VLQYGEPEFWALPDRTLLQQPDLVERFVQKILSTQTDLIYAPSPWEIHPDHRRTASAAIEAASRTGSRLAFYEVGCPLPPNLLLDITPYVDAKKKAMLCFASQLQQQDYDRHIAALNQYRTYTLSREVAAAEAYLLLTPAELADRLPGMLVQKPVSLGASPALGAVAGKPPLVSILVLSAGSPYLQETLDAIALQTYPHIDISVIASAPGHPALPQRCGPFNLNLLPTTTPLRRSVAGNKALASAQGEFVLLLDDGDWLHPGHIAKLIAALTSQPGTLAAYSGMALAGAHGEPLGLVADFLSDDSHHIAHHLASMHAVAFSRKLIAQGCCFDETLDGHENWDFCIQLSGHTLFAHVPGASAVHRITTGRNAHHEPALDPSLAEVCKKWEATWSAGQAAQFRPAAWHHNHLQAQSTAWQNRADAAEQRAQDQAAIITQQTLEIASLRQSTSWRITAPLRWIAIRLKRKMKPFLMK